MVERNAAGEVRAAGGVLWRRRADGVLEVLVVHRPRYDDWSLPKGKVEPGEGDLDAARREVVEETGLAVEAGAELEPVRYVDHKGRPKVVRYWAMRAIGGDLQVNDEVDELRWTSVDAAVALLTHESDRNVLAQLPDVT